MDEDYARKLRAWLKSEPEATPRRPEEEREWLREVPAPAPEGGWSTGDRPPGQPRAADEPLPAPASDERWTVRGRLPREPVEELEEEWVCPVIALPVPRASEENGCRMSAPDERRSRIRRRPVEGTADQPGVTETAECSRDRRLPGEVPGQPGASETAECSWDRRLPGEAPGQPGVSETAERTRDWRLPGEALGRPGVSETAERSRNRRLPGEAPGQPGVSETAERTRDRRLPGEAPGRPGVSETAEQSPQLWHPEGEPIMSDAEARSRWNHPSNWHRRRRAARTDPDQPGSH
ncbi:hypothetical protein SAMN05421837_105836 [Amycolatopsis pretoriensis]|uniref:Uncharacterized protein n=1 Tax=Amycolatopsis pretoriensis TaxID=218821 RepID=A0A1H5R2J4_9PSEU|nr:hypothetical protein [Amycolatopsis pretoriensis]SEF31627.1 hypothetical protein SAMN05421837_105836 [Amycolatopsis pretoriensis]